MKCPICKGKGYVFNRLSLLLTVGLPVAWLCKSDILEEDCFECNGYGYLEEEE